MVVTQLDGLRRYIEAATTFTQITRGRAEELVRDLVASGEVERNRAQDWIEDLVKRSREASETLVATVGSEVDRQLGDRGLKDLDLDDLAQRVAKIIGMAGTMGRTVTSPRSRDRNESGKGATAGKKEPSPKRSAKSDGKSSSGKTSAKKKGAAGTSGTKSSSKQGDKSATTKKAGSKKIAATGTDDPSGTAT